MHPTAHQLMRELRCLPMRRGALTPAVAQHLAAAAARGRGARHGGGPVRALPTVLRSLEDLQHAEEAGKTLPGESGRVYPYVGRPPKSLRPHGL